MTITPTVTVVLAAKLLSELSNYPNPFSPPRGVTHVTYALNQNADVEIEFYNYLGDRLRKLKFEAGEEGGRGTATGYRNTVIWDGRDGKGILLGTGGYICRIEIKPQDGSRTVLETRKIGIIRHK